MTNNCVEIVYFLYDSWHFIKYGTVIGNDNIIIIFVIVDLYYQIKNPNQIF